MNKDVIYIDVEDDITAIIGKVKDAKEKIVAIVPPKRTGVLQSAVNLRLLERAAGQSDKRLVLISNNSALVALAAAAKIPVAKNLQSKPELAEIAALDIDNGEDIIDGSQLPVGELARTADGASKNSAAVGTLAINDAINQNAAEEPARAAPPVAGALPPKPRVKSGIKVPNFGSFRKKLIFGIGGGVLLLAFLIWAIFFAPQATVIITARTTDSSANAKVTLGNNLATDINATSIKSVTQQVKKDLSVDFDPTGKKDVGDKAKGSMTITRSGVSDSATTIPAGTQFTSGSLVFVSTAAATVPRSQIIGSTLDNGSATVSVEATAVGDEYNLSARSYQPSMGGFSAKGTDMSGGSKHQARVVSSDDVQKATDELLHKDADETKKELTGKFDSSYMILDQSYKTDQGKPQSTPGVDQELASGKAKLSASVTYSLTAVTKADVTKYLGDYFDAQLKDAKDQRIFDNGAGGATFTNVTMNKDTITANLVATAKIGPKIDDNAIKDGAKGKRYGDIQSSIESIQGVDNVDVKFWPFWVSSAPNDTNRIKIEFNLNGGQ